MSEPPRRRRSPASPESPRSGGEGSGGGRGLAATIVVGIGVVVAGLGIGAFISALQQRDAHTATSIVAQAPAVTPIAQPTSPPTDAPTLAPTASPLPTDSPEPSASPTPRVSSSPKNSPSARATASAAPTPHASPSAAATAAATATPAPRVETARPEATRVAQSAPATPPPPTQRTVPTYAQTESPNAAAVTPAAPLGFSAIAANTVRRYLADLSAGNESGAYAELGKSSGDGGAALREEAFLDHSAHILSVHTSSTDATGATVQAEIESARGRYFATYHVTNASGSPVIDYHDYIKE